MSGLHVAPQVGEKTETEVCNVAVSFANRLGTGELLSGSPTADATPSGLTLGTAAISESALTINGSSVPAGEAVQFTVSGGDVGTRYRISVVSDTDSDPAQTLEGFIDFDVVAE